MWFDATNIKAPGGIYFLQSWGDSSAKVWAKGRYDMRNWYLINFHERWHDRVKRKILGLGVEIYTPLRQIKRVRSDKINSVRVRNEPLFPGYYFVRLDPDVIHTAKVNAISGVNGFIRFNSQLYCVPDSIISGLRQLGDIEEFVRAEPKEKITEHCTLNEILKINNEIDDPLVRISMVLQLLEKDSIAHN